MKKIFGVLLFLFMLCLPFIDASVWEVQAATTAAQEDVPYTEDNSIQVTVTVAEKRTFTKADFPEINCSDVLVASMNKVGDNYTYELVLVLDASDENFDLTMEMEKLESNPTITRVEENEYVTKFSYMELSDSVIYLHVGQSANVTIKDVELVSTDFTVTGLTLTLDPNVYGTDELASNMFHEYGITKLMTQNAASKNEDLWGYNYGFEEEYDGHFGVASVNPATIKEDYVAIANALSKVEGVEEVSLYFRQNPPGGEPPQETFSVDDESIASVTVSGGESSGIFPVINQTCTITGLAPGETTLKVRRAAPSMSATAECKIVVYESLPEPPLTYDVYNVPKLMNWIKKSRNVSFEDFLDSARNQEELLVVKSNSVFKLTQLYVDEDNAMNYVFERNQLRYIIRVFLPDNPLYTDLDEFITQTNQELDTKYEGAQFADEPVTINEQEVNLYYLDGGTYKGKNGGDDITFFANAYFKVDGYPIQAIMSTTGTGNYPLNWSSSDLKMFDFIFVNGIDTEFESGDVNKNGQIEATDALDVLKDCVKIKNLSTEDSIRADVNGDSVVDAEDALLILKRTVKLIQKFPVEEL